MIENPYQAPQSRVADACAPGLPAALRSQGTWRLFILGVVTLGIYYAHYCARQTRVINEHAGRNAIPAALVAVMFITAYVSLALFIGYFFVDEQHPIAVASNASDWMTVLPVMIWGFCARRTVNGLLSLGASDPHRLSRIWTLFFSPLHFNYMVNRMNEAPAVAAATA